MAHICICSAMCDANRGIGLGKGFPWPFLKRDFEYYSMLTQKPKDPHKKVAYIKGKHTWLSTQLVEKAAPAVVNVVISSKLSENSDPYLHKVVTSFDEAVEYLTADPFKDVIETIWAMGGTRVYERLPKQTIIGAFVLEAAGQNLDEGFAFITWFIYRQSAIHHPRCSHVYLTRIFGSFEADTYFPQFEKYFERNLSIKAEPIEDNGVTYQFEVYERKKI